MGTPRYNNGYRNSSNFSNVEVSNIAISEKQSPFPHHPLPLPPALL